jgi:N-methylhydantoinase B
VNEGKVSAAAARDEYGVVLVSAASEGEYEIDRAGTEKLRATLRAARKGPLPMIDRGPGYERMVRSAPA